VSEFLTWSDSAIVIVIPTTVHCTTSAASLQSHQLPDIAAEDLMHQMFHISMLLIFLPAVHSNGGYVLNVNNSVF